MPPAVVRVIASLARTEREPPALDGFVDALLQKFENCRDGLTDETLSGGGAEAYFSALYASEREALRDAIRLEELHLTIEAREKMFQKVDALIRTVVCPGYARLAARFTTRERNDFYVFHRPLHGLERAGWAAAGALLGGFVIWAPFIPLWSKEWVLPFFLAGLVFPDLRRFIEIRRYETALNRLVAQADAEINRIDVRYLMGEPVLEAGRAASAGAAEKAVER